jgi:hypothetical protein
MYPGIAAMYILSMPIYVLGKLVQIRGDTFADKDIKKDTEGYTRLERANAGAERVSLVLR